jgi:hypothetical protein
MDPHPSGPVIDVAPERDVCVSVEMCTIRMRRSAFQHRADSAVTRTQYDCTGHKY